MNSGVDNTNVPMGSQAQQEMLAREEAAGMLEVCAPRHRALLGILATAETHQFNAAAMVMGLSDEHSGVTGARLLELARLFEKDEPMVESLESVPDVLPPSCVLAIRMAYERGTERQLFQEVSERLPSFDDNLLDDENNFSKLGKLAIKCFVVFCIVSFVALKIIPEFMKIMEEFGVDPSPPFMLLLFIFEIIAKFWFIFLFVILVAFVLSIPSIRRYFRRWNPMTWRQKHLAPAVDRRRALALALRDESPLSSSLRRVLKCKPMSKIFKRLRDASERIGRGEEQWQALAAERIISNGEAKALSVAEGKDTQAWLLRWAAKGRQDNKETRENFVVRTVIVVVNLGIAIFVLLSALAIFSTLLKLMEAANQ